MLRQLSDFRTIRLIERTRSVSVTFSGGLGAQILSMAIYLHFSQRGYDTLADLSYFQKENSADEARGPSQWAWELDCYGISSNSLLTATNRNYIPPLLRDSALKFSLAYEALANPSVKSSFDVATSDAYSVFYRDNDLHGERYLCLHIRRGDYLNVASHLVDIRQLCSVAKRFTGLIERVLVLSDSPIGEDELGDLPGLFPGRLKIIDDDPDPVLAHSLMRNAAVLICSNSQFSLSAGLLSQGLVVIPKLWFGKGYADLNRALDRISDFSVLRM